jgi:PKD repeat protein
LLYYFVYNLLNNPKLLLLVFITFVYIVGYIQDNITNNKENLDIKFVFSPIKPYANEEVLFSIVNNNDSNIINWTWNFGDGNISSDKKPIHIYSNPDKFNVSLLVTDKKGNTASFSKSIVVLYKMPSAKFIYSKNENISVNDVISLTDNSTIGSEKIVNWTRSFGNENRFFYGRNITHNFTEEEIENGCFVKLSVRDARGGGDAISIPICGEKGPILKILNLKLNLEPATTNKYVDLCSLIVKNIGDRTHRFTIQSVDSDGNILMECSDILTIGEELRFTMRGKSPSNPQQWNIGLRVWLDGKEAPEFDYEDTQNMKTWSREVINK